MTNMKMAMIGGFVAAAALVAGSAQAQECKPAHSFKTVEEGTITVAVVTYAPFSFINKDGTLGGVDGDIVKAIAKRECLKVKPVATDPSAAIQYILTGRADLSTGDWYRTAERARWRRLLTASTEMPRAAATSGALRPCTSRIIRTTR